MQPAVSQGALGDAVGTHPPVAVATSLRSLPPSPAARLGYASAAAAGGPVYLCRVSPESKQMASARQTRQHPFGGRRALHHMGNAMTEKAPWETFFDGRSSGAQRRLLRAARYSVHGAV